MAFVEVEMMVERFNDFVRFMATAGPIPIGVLNGLGPDRLITRFSWESIEMGPQLQGFAPQAGTVIGRGVVTISHVSIAELEANPNAPGSTKQATAWIHLSANAVELKLEMVAVEIAGASIQKMPVPIVIRQQRIPALGPVNPVAVAIFLSENIATIRFATRATDPIFSPPLNMLATTADAWSIRLSGELFTEMLLQALQAAPPPNGTTIEDAATASWGTTEDGTWASIGSIGLERKDKCPGLFGMVDISVTINVVLTPTANLALTPEQLNLTLNLSSDVSDWDSFRCWLGSGGIGATALGYIGTALIGPATGGLGFLVGGLVSLIAIAETIRLEAGSELTGTNLPGFNQIASSSTTATYLSTINLPVLFTRLANGTSTGTITAAPTGAFGMLISGNVNFLPATHNVTYAPSSASLAATLQNSYDCKSESWDIKAVVPEVLITDQAQVVGADLGLVPVTIFNSTTALPSNLWSVPKPVPALNQTVKIESTDFIKAGDSGRIYLHSSAGLRRFDIPVLPQVNPPTQQETIAAVAQCQMFTKMFTPREKIEWLIDPPPYDLGYPPFRQWLLTFANLPEMAAMNIHKLRRGDHIEESWSFNTIQRGEGALEIITGSEDLLLLEHRMERQLEARVMQRWIIPIQVIETGGFGMELKRSGTRIVVKQERAVFSYDMASGVSRVQAVKSVENLSRDFGEVHGGRRFEHTHADIKTAIAPFTLTLPGGKVAALFEDKLVIGIGWRGRVVR